MKSDIYVIEGSEGAGKTTATRLVIQKLKEEYPHRQVHHLREPGGSERAEKIRSEIKEMHTLLEPFQEAILFKHARKAMAEDNEEMLNDEKNIIVMDRSVISSLVYQGILGGVGVDKVLRENEDVMQLIPIRHAFLLDGSVDVFLKRINDREEKDEMYDSAPRKVHEQIIEGYRSLLTNRPSLLKDIPFDRIDAERTPEEIATEIVKHITQGGNKND